MQKRLFVFLSGAALLMVTETHSRAEEKIQKMVDRKGKIYYANFGSNTPQPAVPVLPQDRDPLAREMPGHLRALVDTISANHGIDPALVRAVMKTESNFDRWAVSNKGAMGLMQLIPATAKRFGVRDPFDPHQNIDGGVRYLKFLLEKFGGNIDLALAGYNAGENLVARLGRVPPIRETTNYVRKIRGIYRKPAATMMQSAVARAAVEAPKEEVPRIYRTVDSRGVVHYSNVGPPNY
jgi:soluble lytic murein transglycosylase-like protein